MTHTMGEDLTRVNSIYYVFFYLFIFLLINRFCIIVVSLSLILYYSCMIKNNRLKGNFYLTRPTILRRRMLTYKNEARK